MTFHWCLGSSIFLLTAPWVLTSLHSSISSGNPLVIFRCFQHRCWWREPRAKRLCTCAFLPPSFRENQRLLNTDAPWKPLPETVFSYWQKANQNCAGSFLWGTGGSWPDDLCRPFNSQNRWFCNSSWLYHRGISTLSLSKDKLRFGRLSLTHEK